MTGRGKRAVCRSLGPLATLAIAGLIGGCASGTAATAPAPGSLAAAVAAPTAAATPEPTATPAPAAEAEPATSLAGAVVTGRAVCIQTASATSVAPGQWRGSAISCEVRSADPRLAGRQTVHVNVNVLADERAFIWGTSRLETSQGTWEGPYAAMAEAPYPKGTHHIGAVLDGTGADAGLRMLTTWTTGSSGEDYDVLAWIEPLQ
jgi:hypothetical protein